MYAARTGLFTLGLILIIGCGKDPDPIYDVSGTVTFDNKAVPKGMVFFDPDASAGGIGTQGFAPISDGKFNTALGGRGICGGGYNIRVIGQNGKTTPESPYGAPLFSEYTFKKDLPKSQSELAIEVPKKK